jgi:hypothetical protein
MRRRMLELGVIDRLPSLSDGEDTPAPVPSLL